MLQTDFGKGTFGLIQESACFLQKRLSLPPLPISILFESQINVILD